MTDDLMLRQVIAIKAAELARENPSATVESCARAGVEYADREAGRINEVWADYTKKYPSLGGL